MAIVGDGTEAEAMEDTQQRDVLEKDVRAQILRHIVVEAKKSVPQEKYEDALSEGPLHWKLAYAVMCSAKAPIAFIISAIALLRMAPKKTTLAIISYYLLRFKSEWWQVKVADWAQWANSSQPKHVRRQTVPYDATKQHIIMMHPHGLLADGLVNLGLKIDGRNVTTNPKLFDGLKYHLCVSSWIKWFPIIGESMRDRVSNADSKTIRRVLNTTDHSPLCVPGGFSEAMYCGASPDVEYQFLEGRFGMFKIAIEQKVDLTVTYCFGLNDMYRTPAWKRHERAGFAQDIGIPIFTWWGRWGTSMPLTEHITMVTFDPFPASKYSMDQLEQCHSDYKAYLTECFDSYKHECGYGHRRLEFIGRKFKPTAAAAPVTSKL